MDIKTWLEYATADLSKVGITSARLDAEVILAHTLEHPRTWLHAHSDEKIDLRHQEIANARIDLRLDFVPIAYIIGHKEFYGRHFSVSPATLIPRPESELLIELLGDLLPTTHALEIGTPKHLVDIGTGSGCLGITAKLEHPELDVTLLDTSRAALRIAEKNAAALQAKVSILQSDLLESYPFEADFVLANLPYVDQSWNQSPEVRHEPSEALYARGNGLSLIRRCFSQLEVRVNPGSYAIFEADPRQWDAINEIAISSGFSLVKQELFATCYRKD